MFAFFFIVMRITFWFNTYPIIKLFSFSCNFVERFSELREYFGFFCVYFLTVLRSLWDPSSSTRD